MRFHPPLVQMEWVKSSLPWCCSALCTAHIPQPWKAPRPLRRGSPAALTVKSSRASFEQLQAKQPRAPSSKPPQLKQNKTEVTLSLLPPGSATTVSTSTERDAGLCGRGKGILQLFIGKISLYKFSPPLRYTIKIQNTGHRLNLSINS